MLGRRGNREWKKALLRLEGVVQLPKKILHYDCLALCVLA